ncbi:MAG TPA: histidine kinase, partial [Pasteurellaceae bacterium]|nr:histidine kinase [Pasteurellaceae bacterium]
MDTSLIPNIELFIGQVSPFNHLPKAMITQITSNIEIRYIPKGEAVVSENETDNYFLYIIRIGAVKQVNKDGELRAKLESGDIFGFSIFNSEDSEKYSAYAIENCLIYQLSYAFLNTLLKQYPEYAAYFSCDTGTRLHSTTKNSLLKSQDNLLMKTAAEVANPKVALIDADATIQQAAQKMCEQRRSSALIMQDGELIGIVNDRDMTKKVVAQAINVHSPIIDIMTPNPPVIAANDLILNAVSLMMQNNIRNLPVMMDGKIQGILTATDLVKQNSIQSIFIINHIFQADSLPLLVDLAKQQRSVFAALIESGAYYNNVMRVMTLIADAFAQKLLMMAEHKFGTPPCRYVWMVSGSQARYEIHLLSDQDHAVITERELTEQEQEYFARLTKFVSDGLHQCGYEYCT